MASATSLSPNSSPSAVPPTGFSVASPPPATTLPDQTTDPPVPSTTSNSSAPPPQTPPPATPAASPPSPPASPPPSLSRTPPPSAPPPSPPASPPPAPPASPPQSTPIVPPPAVTTSPPPPPDVSPPPRSASSPPSPQSSPTTPVAPPPQAVAPSPPSPVNVPTPSTDSPPPPAEKAPESSPAPPNVTPPSSSHSDSPPPVTKSPPPLPTSALPSPPPSVPSTSLPHVPPAPPDSSSTTGTSPLSPLPSIPTEKPTARATSDGNVSANTTSKGAGNFNTGVAVVIGIVVGFVVLSFLVLAAWVVQKRKRRHAKSNIGYTMPSPFSSSQNSESFFLRPLSHGPLGGSPSGSDFIYSPSEPGGVSNSRPWFTYEELVQATDGFSTKNLLGEGGFGCVYKGILVDGREVAVKQLKIGGSQGEREFKAEVEIISRVHHRHLVSLVGYCTSENQRLLIYDYVPNDTLHYHLHGQGRPVLDWAIRVKVAAGAARGIAYLHEDCHPRIIHRDIKSSNILLDNNFEARVHGS
ncbi:hypothetical protein MANES_01G107400v8 [Manihot esculenta]|uniref:Uncharacterized protein n=1 Tax=Manihot esculenta TaxID=3983 RepID=A0ACB7IDK2_MANES|nr:hypothetical protein MANES_01G107400v8 [Manihot esculenta]